MNSNFLRAASKDSKQTLPTRSWKCSLMLALVTLMCVSSAFAAPGVQIGNQNMFRPSGLILATVPNPAGGTVSDWWVADEASGFCRLDNTAPYAGAATPPSNGILNLSTCYLPGTFAPVDYQAETKSAGLINKLGVVTNGYVFVAGIK
jgi:hypothetical protein